MSVSPPNPSRFFFRFGLPPSLGNTLARERAEQLTAFIERSLDRKVEVSVAASYEALAKDLLAGRADAVWAPPFVCARVEAMGVRVLARGVRRGRSSYRSALVARAGSGLSLLKLQGSRVAWVDRDSVAGYLLPVACLKAKGLEPAKTFASQQFSGSYKAALESVLSGAADVASVFCPPESTGLTYADGVEVVLPGKGGAFELIAYTDEAPNDGVPVGMGVAPELVGQLERALLALHESDEGKRLLEELFSAERFEPAPRMGYRALYRVALASL
ncbi:phosphate/phosphite/phosphonate ABC transporter substrate-binding protein [Vitiosangium sp. GDMCC 1.1324]|uniref:phosphate/phosphite/phosphonate ABC transporter substrate-binding protein n=1 Tax=Vitiosangium sp. (strain GDMCC 1.1324) TaxID=2138576 RepID=UPI000D3D90CA|nr:PhnD/SsuA/transferrin family substrate-binding protein [Vitiosangium sp. GDMCC 1.1324]PTL83902.1 phosphonate ABC transporter substrate-binding protein [Vitiosangium sp. GDMCC 1.1324]